ncbi:MAG: hypothetical protein MJ072_02440, partial [Clostridia bacterium]|nr:hypothetical protein [Clostridia bacterium]
TDKWDVRRYLTEDEIVDAEYTVKTSVDSAITSYISEDEETVEKYNPTPRTAPTDAAAYTRELTTTEKKNFVIDRGVASDGKANDAARRAGYQKLLKALEIGGYIGEDFDWLTDSILDTEYFKESVKESEEEILLEKYERYLSYGLYATVTLDGALSDYYAGVYAAQKNTTQGDYAAYLSALGDASASSPIVYNPYQGFGYIYNLLLGVNNVQTSDIDAVKKDYESGKINKETYRTERNEVLLDTIAYDLRDTWITAGYDFNYTTGEFMNDYKIAEETLPYDGRVMWINQGDYQSELCTDDKGNTYFRYYTMEDTNKVYDDEYAPKYEVRPNKYTIDPFLNMMDTYLFGASQSRTAGNIATTNGKGQIPYYAALISNASVTGWADKINELLFAFSTDGGSLNTYKGYTIDKGYSVGYTETYVDEFAAAARYLMEQAATGNTSSYIVVGTDYGWHIIFYSELVNLSGTEDYPTLSEYLTSLGITDGASLYKDILHGLRDGDTTEYEKNYLYLLQQAVASSSVSSELNKKLQNDYDTYSKDGSKIVVYNERLANII